MEKDKVLNFITTFVLNHNNGDIVAEEFKCLEDSSLVYSVRNLDKNPEEAVINKGLLSANEFAFGVLAGMELAHKGYNTVVQHTEVVYEMEDGSWEQIR